MDDTGKGSQYGVLLPNYRLPTEAECELAPQSGPAVWFAPWSCGLIQPSPVELFQLNPFTLSIIGNRPQTRCSYKKARSLR